MPFLLHILRISFFLLVLFQTPEKASGYYAVTPVPEASLDLAAAAETSDPVDSQLYTYQLPAPEAIVSPLPSFQFGISAAFSLPAVVLPGWYNNGRISGGGIYRSVCSYFRTLFSSLILINAP
jgi:hypothetical protein